MFSKVVVTISELFPHLFRSMNLSSVSFKSFWKAPETLVTVHTDAIRMALHK